MTGCGKVDWFQGEKGADGVSGKDGGSGSNGTNGSDGTSGATRTYKAFAVSTGQELGEVWTPWGTVNAAGGWADSSFWLKLSDGMRILVRFSDGTANIDGTFPMQVLDHSTGTKTYTAFPAVYFTTADCSGTPYMVSNLANQSHTILPNIAFIAGSKWYRMTGSETDAGTLTIRSILPPLPIATCGSANVTRYHAYPLTEYTLPTGITYPFGVLDIRQTN